MYVLTAWNLFHTIQCLWCALFTDGVLGNVIHLNPLNHDYSPIILIMSARTF